MITYLFTTLVCEVSARKIMFQVLLDFTIFAYAESILEMEPITQETDYNSSAPWWGHMTSSLILYMNMTLTGTQTHSSRVALHLKSLFAEPWNSTAQVKPTMRVVTGHLKSRCAWTRLLAVEFSIPGSCHFWSLELSGFECSSCAHISLCCISQGFWV